MCFYLLTATGRNPYVNTNDDRGSQCLVRRYHCRSHRIVRCGLQEIRGKCQLILIASAWDVLPPFLREENQTLEEKC